MGKIDTWNIDKLTTSLQNITNLYGESKEMVEFLVKNFKKAQK